ncbi:MAG: class I SAM-dependent methyltransferase [Acidobacteria bacterium]|nr:class I SAM-dependent methyltransferase [Acidobacteriota bacterium]
MIVELYDRLRKVIQKRGWKGTLKLIGWKIGYFNKYWFSPTQYRERRLDREYDFKFGVDTDGILDLRELGVDSPNIAHATWYEQTKPAAFDELMKHLRVRFQDFTFIDFGSGKGRAVFLASEYPFRKIIGVEFARPLHEIAEQNLAYYYSPTQKCETIELYCQDVTDFTIPPEPSVYYFYNPFDAEVMRKVLENITQSLRITPRPVFILYCNSRLRELMQQYGFIEIASSVWYSVLRNDLPTSSKIQVVQSR